MIRLEGALVPSAALAGTHKNSESIAALLKATDKLPEGARPHARSRGEDKRGWRICGVNMSRSCSYRAKLRSG
jgi:hypothetical protein